MLDNTSIGLRFFIAIVIVGLAIGGFFAVLGYLRRRNPGLGFLGQARPRHARLDVIESVPVDARRRMVLVRRDNVEHLLLIGGGADLVIEQAIDAPYEAAEPSYEDNRYFSEDEQEDSYYDEEPEPQPVIRRPAPTPQPQTAAAPQRAASPADQSIGLRYTSSWEDDEDEPGTPPLRPVRKPAASAEFSDIERLPNEPPVGTIRPVTVSRGERPAAQPQQAAASGLSPEEAALARELEAARRRAQGPQGARPALPAPQAQQGGNRIDFDRVLEQEMEDQLEAAKRALQQNAAARPVVQQQRREGQPQPQRPQAAASTDPRSMQSGMQRIFGDGSNAEKPRR